MKKSTSTADESEVKYQELLAKYEGTPYKEPQEITYVPRPRQGFNFVFYDTVKEIEELG